MRPSTASPSPIRSRSWPFCRLLPFVFDGVLRRWVGRRVVRLRRWAPPALALALASASAAKIVLVMTGGYGGFAACYRSAYDPPASACELSFDNPFQRFDATRLDAALDFGAADWNFGFINSARFSIQPLPGSPLRDRLPFEVYWRGWVEVPLAATGLTLTYTGEAQLNLGSARHTLPRRYGVAATATVPVRAGGRPSPYTTASTMGIGSGRTARARTRRSVRVCPMRTAGIRAR